MNNEETTLPSIRNIERRTVKTGTNKINHVLPYKSTNNITELNADAKLLCEKIGISLKSPKVKSKPGWEIRMETQTKNLRNRAKIINKGKTLEYVGRKMKR